MERQDGLNPVVDALSEAFKAHVAEEIQKLREEIHADLKELIDGAFSSRTSTSKGNESNQGERNG